VIPGGRKPNDPQSPREGHRLSRPFDGTQQQALVLRVRNAAHLELETRDAQQRKHKPQDRREHCHAPLQLHDTMSQLGLALQRGVDGHDGTNTAAHPTAAGGQGDLKLREEVRVSGGDDLRLDPVVVRATFPMGHRAGRTTARLPVWPTRLWKKSE
jgi:hypothetical protein